MVSVVELTNAMGSAPNFRLVERFLASDCVKCPVICALPAGIRLWKVGAEMTWPSRTIANC